MFLSTVQCYMFIAVTLTDFVMRKVYMYSDYIEV